jgi:hypothetical protein
VCVRRLCGENEFMKDVRSCIYGKSRKLAIEFARRTLHESNSVMRARSDRYAATIRHIQLNSHQCTFNSLSPTQLPKSCTTPSPCTTIGCESNAVAITAGNLQDIKTRDGWVVMRRNA